jgi:chemotaxis protein MotB
MLAGQLQGIPNKLLIEGHTDAKPYPDAHGYTNWELSADRANSARRIFQESGVPQEQIAQIRGFADQRLRNKADPLDPANRRISVLVQYSEGAAEPPPSEKAGTDARPASGTVPPKAGH